MMRVAGRALWVLGLLSSVAAAGSLRPTDLRWHSMQLAPGGRLDYILIEPDGEPLADGAPVLLALPPGRQDRQMVERGLELYFEHQARLRGWVVVSPAAPAGHSLLDDDALMDAFVDRLLEQLHPEGGRLHLAGVSNGGRTALHLATRRATDFASLTLAPGAPAGDDDWERLADLAGLPLAMYVGGEDSDWLEQAQRTIGRLRELGATDRELHVLSGQGHVLDASLAGTLFDRLDRLRARQAAARREQARVAEELGDLHAAAASADYDRYFGHFAPEAVFLGTDATERWTLARFRAYARPHFEGPSAWTYEALERHVRIGGDGSVAWFDERLHNARYGETRGSGVLVLRDDRWRITQYVLSFAIPNERAEQVVELIGH